MHYTNQMPPNYYPPQLQRALELIRKALAGETKDRLFYEFLLEQAPNPTERNIIASIRDDEIKHFAMFRQIYREITGQNPTPLGEEEFEEPENYLAGIAEALFGELSAVEMYRQIYFALRKRSHRDMLFEIITDELKHATKWNFLYTLNYNI